MASSRPERPRNPTSKLSAAVNVDFQRLLPFQRKDVEVAAARDAARQAASSSLTAQPLSNHAPSADSSDQLAPGTSDPVTPVPKSSVSNKHPASPSTPSDDEESESNSSGLDKAAGSAKIKKKARKKTRKRLRANTILDQNDRDADGMHNDVHVMDINDSEADKPKKKRNATADIKHFFTPALPVSGSKSGRARCETC
ncbi:hypothetical protein JOM56_015115 [Amanita muscaria]